jgi:site-specific recombinase XerD
LTFSRLRYGPAMTPDHAPSLARSFERHLRAENCSDNTIESYLESIRQAEAFLATHGRSLLDARRAELVGLRLADLDLDLDVAIVVGKGRRERAVPFGRKTAVALDRYLRARARHRHADLPWLWLGQRGLLGPYGVRQILRRRGAEAGLPDLHAHQLRHTFAHAWLAQGGGETDLMRLAGWRSRAMLGRYGASAAGHLVYARGYDDSADGPRRRRGRQP